MSITTRRGDDGWAELPYGRRVRKNDVRLRACGSLDELGAFLGLARAELDGERAEKLLARQRDLLIVSAEVVALPDCADRLSQRMRDEMIERLDADIAALEEGWSKRGERFALTGENRTAALLDVCRCVARRAERDVATVADTMPVPPLVPAWLNRLSDWLFLLARDTEASPA